MDNLEMYANAMTWWNSKTSEQKLKIVGVETLDKWVEEIVRKEYLALAESVV
jgi:hypothetical protein